MCESSILLPFEDGPNGPQMRTITAAQTQKVTIQLELDAVSDQDALQALASIQRSIEDDNLADKVKLLIKKAQGGLFGE